jgi:hypothetical protein
MQTQPKGRSSPTIMEGGDRSEEENIRNCFGCDYVSFTNDFDCTSKTLGNTNRDIS